MQAWPTSPVTGVKTIEQFDPESPALKLYDLTLHPRFGLRGPGAPAFLANQHISEPERVNQCLTSAKGETILRLGKTETWVLAGAEPSVYFNHWQLKLVQQGDNTLYPLYNQHSHCWFLLTGEAKAELMAKLCGVDLAGAAFPVGSIAQTSVARTSSVIAHHEFAKQAVFSLFCDISYGQYFAEVLLDAIKHA